MKKELQILMDYVIPGSSNYCLEKMLNDPQFEDGIKQLIMLFKAEIAREVYGSDKDFFEKQNIRKFINKNFRNFNNFAVVLAEIYYLDPDVRNNLGLDNSPPFPNGNSQSDFDLNLLEEVYNVPLYFKHNI